MRLQRIQHLLNWFRQPYPCDFTIKGNWSVILLISSFIFFFLVVFQYGIFQAFSLSQRLLFGLLFSAACSLTFILSTVLFPTFFKNAFSEKRWTVWKEIAFTMWHFFSIGTVNAFLVSGLGWTEMNISLFFQQQLSTFFIGIIPITIYVLINYNQSLRQQLKTALSINEQIQQELHKKSLPPSKQVSLKARTKNLETIIPIQDLLYISSEKNYIKIVLQKDQQLEEIIQRNTISDAIAVFEEFEYIVKCHRAFIVNSKKIISVEGNSQGLQVTLPLVSTTIPVSRKFVKNIRELFN